MQPFAYRCIILNAFRCTSEPQIGCILLQICVLYYVHPLHACLLPSIQLSSAGLLLLFLAAVTQQQARMLL